MLTLNHLKINIKNKINLKGVLKSDVSQFSLSLLSSLPLPILCQSAYLSALSVYLIIYSVVCLPVTFPIFPSHSAALAARGTLAPVVLFRTCCSLQFTTVPASSHNPTLATESAVGHYNHTILRV